MPTSLAFPFKISVTGGIAATTSPAEQAGAEIINAVTTAARERVLRPSYGAGIRNWLFKPNSEITANEVTDAIRDAVDRHVPSVILQKATGQTQGGVLFIDLAYTLRSEIEGDTYVLNVSTNGEVTEVR